MWRHKDWLLCGTFWTACSMIMTTSSDNITYDFRHDNDKALRAWYEHKVMSWHNYNNMGDAYKRVCKITHIVWEKCTHFRKQAIEDSQLKGCVLDKVTQQTGHVKSSFSNACCNDMNQNMLHVCSGFNIQKEDYFVLLWNIDANDTD